MSAAILGRPMVPANPPGVTVVVPIHNAFEAVTSCLEALGRHTAAGTRVLLIDDASGDPRIGPLLAAATADAGDLAIEVLRNERRYGYTATVNRGCRHAGADDVVLLNSDTEVTPRWLEKMAATARSRHDVATVTAVSNAAGAFSVPVRGRPNPLPDGMSGEEMARLVEEISPRCRPVVPTGNGFCMLVRREALEQVGTFDAVSFPEGCGEENDFCIRASEAGFTHLVDDGTWIYHRGAASFGWRKRWLVARGTWRLRKLHPDYEVQVARWLVDDPLDELRRRLAEALASRSTSP